MWRRTVRLFERWCWIQARSRKNSTSFKQEVLACAKATEIPEVWAVHRFLEALDPSKLGLEADFSADDNLTFVVDGVRPIDLPEVQRYWADQFGVAEGADGAKGLRAECLTRALSGQSWSVSPSRSRESPAARPQG